MKVPAVMSSASAKFRLVLSQSDDEPGGPADWIGPMVALGCRAARHHRKNGGRQLVIAVSVPRRDFAAVLIGCGWVLASEKPELPTPLDTLRKLERGKWVRAVNKRKVLAGAFLSLDESVEPPRARFAGREWTVDKVQALSEIEDWEPNRGTCSQDRPEPGSMARMAGLDSVWDAWLARPAADLAIVGTAEWLKEDSSACLTKEDDEDLERSSIGSVLLPRTPKAATWCTRILSAMSLPDRLPLLAALKAVILDGNGAIKWLPDIEAPVVICVLDRSRADEATEEVVLQLRNTRGEPLSLSKDLGWTPPGGVEALGFTVAL